MKIREYLEDKPNNKGILILQQHMLLLHTINYNDRNEIDQEIFKNFHEMLVEDYYPMSTRRCNEQEQNKLIQIVILDYLELLKNFLLIIIEEERKNGEINEQVEIGENEEDEVVDVSAENSDEYQSSDDSGENQSCDASDENKDEVEVNSYAPENNDTCKGEQVLMNLTKVTVNGINEASTITKKKSTRNLGTCDNGTKTKKRCKKKGKTRFTHTKKKKNVVIDHIIIISTLQNVKGKKNLKQRDVVLNKQCI